MADRVPKDAEGKPRRRTTLEVITRAVRDKLAGSSGMAASAGRRVSGRQRQVDAAVDRASRGDNELRRKIENIDRETTK